ncbi:unnamed protein product [Hydatigera taeniaeformis]|uniref:Uncharacterized protein n=1 Tax=Hydatigena taeniaeformis TaxID=6205 RepID=A0A3P7GZF2_HYDTA|nr:unnamed protein product [Hydatigera taeniaeformis]
MKQSIKKRAFISPPPERHLNRIGLVFHREDDQQLGDGKTTTAIAKVTAFQQTYNGLLPHLQDLETALRFLLPIFALAKAGVVIGGFSKSRRILRAAFNRIFALRNTPLCHNQTRDKISQATETSIVPNHVESIPFTVLTNSPIPRIDPRKTPVYINLEDVEELAV